MDTLFSRYQPPSLAISTLYWKAWPLLLVVAAFNPENIGEPSCHLGLAEGSRSSLGPRVSGPLRD